MEKCLKLQNFNFFVHMVIVLEKTKMLIPILSQLWRQSCHLFEIFEKWVIKGVWKKMYEINLLYEYYLKHFYQNILHSYIPQSILYKKILYSLINILWRLEGMLYQGYKLTYNFFFIFVPIKLLITNIFFRITTKNWQLLEKLSGNPIQILTTI